MKNNQLNNEEANKTTVLRLYNECLNRKNMDIAGDVISPRFVPQGPAGVTGPEGFKATAAGLLAGFPDIQFTVHDLITQDDRVAVYWTWEGTHRGPFANIQPTGRQVHHEGMVLYRFEDGKVVDAKAMFDRLSVIQQLGGLPMPPAPGGERPKAT